MLHEDYQEQVLIGLPVYNGEERLRGALDSLLAQTYPYFTLLISDDASTDRTQTICEEYAAKDKKILYVRQPKNLGQVGNFNYVWNAAKDPQFDFFMMASDDDYWHPQFIEKLYMALMKNPQCDIAMSSFTRGLKRGDIPYLFEEGEKKIKLWDAIRPGNARDKFYYFGLVRTSLIEFLPEKIFPDCWLYDCVGQFRMLLLGRVYMVSEILWHKTSYKKSVVKKYEEREDFLQPALLLAKAQKGYWFNILKAFLEHPIL